MTTVDAALPCCKPLFISAMAFRALLLAAAAALCGHVNAGDPSPGWLTCAESPANGNSTALSTVSCSAPSVSSSLERHDFLAQLCPVDLEGRAHHHAEYVLDRPGGSEGAISTDVFVRWSKPPPVPPPPPSRHQMWVRTVSPKLLMPRPSRPTKTRVMQGHRAGGLAYKRRRAAAHL